jgi:hypothetical protein
MKIKLILHTLILALMCIFTGNAQSPSPSSGKKPNILVIFGDDIGQTNISAYSMGVMGYKTPNIDRIAKEGMIFTDYYAEQSCTAAVGLSALARSLPTPQSWVRATSTLARAGYTTSTSASALKVMDSTSPRA